VMLCLTAPDEPWRFTRQGVDRWRGVSGENAGEVLAVLRSEDGVRLDIATFVFSRDPAHLA
jgi:hypothetical protein